MHASECWGNITEQQVKMHGSEQIRGLISYNFTCLKRGMASAPTIGPKVCQVPVCRECQNILGSAKEC